QHVGDLGVLRGEPRGRIDEKEDDLGLRDRPLGLAPHLDGERLGLARPEPAGIDEEELPPPPPAGDLGVSARDAGAVGDDAAPANHAGAVSVAVSMWYVGRPRARPISARRVVLELPCPPTTSRASIRGIIASVSSCRTVMAGHSVLRTFNSRTRRTRSATIWR